MFVHSVVMLACTSSRTCAKALSEGEVPMRAEDGNEFYIDPKTKQRTDQRPEAEAWISLYDEERERNYYFNELTNVSCCAGTQDRAALFVVICWRQGFPVDCGNTCCCWCRAASMQHGCQWHALAAAKRPAKPSLRLLLGLHFDWPPFVRPICASNALDGCQ